MVQWLPLQARRAQRWRRSLAHRWPTGDCRDVRFRRSGVKVAARQFCPFLAHHRQTGAKPGRDKQGCHRCSYALAPGLIWNNVCTMIGDISAVSGATCSTPRVGRCRFASYCNRLCPRLSPSMIASTTHGPAHSRLIVEGSARERMGRLCEGLIATGRIILLGIAMDVIYRSWYPRRSFQLRRCP